GRRISRRSSGRAYRDRPRAIHSRPAPSHLRAPARASLRARNCPSSEGRSAATSNARRGWWTCSLSLPPSFAAKRGRVKRGARHGRRRPRRLVLPPFEASILVAISAREAAVEDVRAAPAQILALEQGAAPILRLPAPPRLLGIDLEHDLVADLGDPGAGYRMVDAARALVAPGEDDAIAPRAI